MALILNIDTATATASICLAKDGRALALQVNTSQKDHATWIQAAIQSMMAEARYKLSELQAVAVTAGPGSYTGLRVGMATAKGLCFALQLPLLTENTLKVMAYAAREHFFPQNTESASNETDSKQTHVFGPMIDARRMEVFTALYSADLGEIMAPVALILEKDAFNKQLENNSILFLGNGSAKWKPVCDHPNARFETVNHTAEHLAQLAERLFLQEKFASLAYEEPVYLKEFYTYIKK